VNSRMSLFAIFFMVAIIAAFGGVKQKRAIPGRREQCSTAAPVPAIRPHEDAPDVALVPGLAGLRKRGAQFCSDFE
jgi:hypothetical protein